MMSTPSDEYATDVTDAFWAVETVYDYFRRWSLNGVWPSILDRLTSVGGYLGLDQTSGSHRRRCGRSGRLEARINKLLCPWRSTAAKAVGRWRLYGADLNAWVADLKKTPKIDLEVVAKEGTGFTLLKRRWVVERTFAWLSNFRRHARDYEVLPRHSEALIQIAMIHLLLKRLA